MSNLLLQHQVARQATKFVTVGFGNTVLDWLVFSVAHIFLAELGQLGRQLAKAISYSIASVSSFYFNRRWTFRSYDRSVYHQASKFLTVSLVGLATNNFLFFLATADAALALPNIAGLIIATGGTAIWNFLANKYWTFKSG